MRELLRLAKVDRCFRARLVCLWVSQMQLKDLIDRRLKLIADARAIIDEAGDDGMSAEQEERYDRIMDDADKAHSQIERRRRLADAEGVVERITETREHTRVADLNPTEKRGPLDRGANEYRSAFWQQFRQTRSSLGPEEFRALQIGTDSEGGYLAPDDFMARIIDLLEEQNVVRNLATKIQTSSGTMDIPVVSSHGTASWTAEEAAYTESDEAFGVVQLGAHKAATIMKVSEELLNDAAFNLESYIANEYARRLAALEETGFTTGDGSGKPTGFVGSATNTIDAAATGAITSDEIIDVYHALGRAYRRNAAWMAKDGTIKLIRKLKDGDSQYLWQPGLQAGEPDRLLGHPLYVNDSMAAVAASAKVLAFGDFSYYWVADRTPPAFQRLSELYAANGQVGFRGYHRVDGKLTLAVAIEVLQMAAV